MENTLRVSREHCFDYNIVWRDDFADLPSLLEDLDLCATKIRYVSESWVPAQFAVAEIQILA